MLVAERMLDIARWLATCAAPGLSKRRIVPAVRQHGKLEQVMQKNPACVRGMKIPSPSRTPNAFDFQLSC